MRPGDCWVWRRSSWFAAGNPHILVKNRAKEEGNTGKTASGGQPL
ncbi:hypothetical protein HMPREF9374_2422 [Desmospora sp. 8437]|nr:hypothetical protein HMPREF9374_2422 [Desmospora sp. 8437]